MKGFLKLVCAILVFWAVGVATQSYADAAEAEKKPEILSQTPRKASVFILPRLFEQPTKTFVALQHGGYKQARQALQLMIRWFPSVPVLEYDPKGYEARRKLSRLVLEKLSKIFEHNFRNVKKIPQKRYLESRKVYSEFAPLIKKAIDAISQDSGMVQNKPVPREIVDLKAVVDGKNTAWDPRLNVLKILFRLSQKKPELKRPVGGKSPAARLVNDWYAKGLAAGNYGDIYDNRDNGHSRLRRKHLPQMSTTVYGKEARAALMHYGLNIRNFYNAITIGNSSTARLDRLWRSQARTALTTPGSPKLLYLQYITNHLYFYPEHNDHDLNQGDVMPANTPYMIVSQGSSGSDKPFMRAIGSILAAFKPQVKEVLKKTGLVMPTVQMIFRRGQKGIESDRDYLNGKAHPSVFQAEKIDLLKMVKLANGLKIEEVPPMVGIKMIEESSVEKGIDSQPANFNGKLFDTPGAIARVVRFTAFEKRMLVQAASKWIKKPEKLTYHWVVLRGDADRIKIIPKNANGSRVEIIVPWHERTTVPGRPEMKSDRVDIGVFVSNSKHLSAPAFISLMYPGYQKRVYNDAKQILSVDYQYLKHKTRYADPLLFPVRDWRDIYQYDLKGRLIGWKRQANFKSMDYTRHGAIVIERDKFGRAIKAQKVKYLARPAPKSRQIITAQRLPAFLYYQYASDEDRIGSLVVK